MGSISSYLSKIKRTLSDKAIALPKKTSKKHYCKLYALFHPRKKFQPLPPATSLNIKGKQIIQNQDFENCRMSNRELESIFRIIEAPHPNHRGINKLLALTLSSGEKLKISTMSNRKIFDFKSKTPI